MARNSENLIIFVLVVILAVAFYPSASLRTQLGVAVMFLFAGLNLVYGFVRANKNKAKLAHFLDQHHLVPVHTQGSGLILFKSGLGTWDREYTFLVNFQPLNFRKSDSQRIESLSSFVTALIFDRYVIVIDHEKNTRSLYRKR